MLFQAHEVVASLLKLWSQPRQQLDGLGKLVEHQDVVLDAGAFPPPDVPEDVIVVVRLRTFGEIAAHAEVSESRSRSAAGALLERDIT